MRRSLYPTTLNFLIYEENFNFFFSEGQEKGRGRGGNGKEKGVEDEE